MTEKQPKVMPTPEKLYRYHNFRTTLGVTVQEYKYHVIKETPCGYWIRLYDSFEEDKYNKKWVPKNTRKRFAYPTKEEALTSFIARKRSQIKILEAQLNDARLALHAKAPMSALPKPKTSPLDRWKKRLFNV